MREYLFPIMGITSMLVGAFLLIKIALILTINKNSRLYKYLTRPGRGWLEEYMKENLSEKANRIIETIVCIVFGIALIVLGLNTLLKGLIDPYGSGFWFWT